MSYRLYARPRLVATGPDQPTFSWVLQDAAGDAQASGESDTRQVIEQVLSQNALEKVELIGLIPAEESVFCYADIPAKQSRFIAQALPYAVEEQVAQDVDTLHLALGEHTDEGYQVGAIDKQRMAYWQELFTGWSNASLTAIYPDASLLPVPKRGWTLCLDNGRVLLQSAGSEWLALQTDNLPLFAPTLAEPTAEEVSAEVPVTLYSSALEREHQARSLSAFTEAIDRLHVTEETLNLPVTEFLACSLARQYCQPINFCQGQHAVTRNNRSVLSVWKPLLAVAAVWFAIQVAMDVGMGIYQKSQAEQLEASAMELYRDIFPNDTRTHAGNVRRVIEGQMRAARNGAPQTGFLTLLQYTGEQYSRLPNADSVTFNSINYSRNRGELVVDLTANSYDRMSQLRTGLANAGLRAQIGSVVNEAGGARGRLTVSGDQ